MQNEELNEWAKKLNRAVYNEWKTNYSDWQYGFRIFFGPPKMNPTVLIISLNPGASTASTRKFQEERDRFESGDFSPPKELSYWVRNYGMSKQVKDLFGEQVDLLKDKTVAFPVCFFRSHNWDEIPRPTRQRMKRFCFPMASEIINRMPAKRMLIIGFKTYDYLEDNILANGNEGVFRDRVTSFRNGNGERLLEESKWESKNGCVPVLATLHLTGALGISNKERRILRQKFHDWISR